MERFRFDPLRNRYVILSPVRKKRPHITEKEPVCPFCPGNENQTPPEVCRIEGENGWKIRVIPNKYPIIPERHEVVIETPDHHGHLWKLGIDEIRLYLEVLKERSERIKKLPDVAHVCIFKNHGKSAGASIPHPHTQIIGLPFTPPHIEREEKILSTDCPLCSHIKLEQYIVLNRGGIVALCPQFSAFPYQIWILPEEHTGSWSRYRDIESIAAALSDVFRGLHRILGPFEFNMLFMDSRHHWRIEIVPRTTTIAGLELATSTFVNPVPPEEAAEKLKKALHKG